MPQSQRAPIAKGPIFVIPPEQGHSHWMPENGGHTTIIISPWDHPMLSYTMGVQCLQPGQVLPEHYHDRNEELFYFIDGRGTALLDGVPHHVGKGHTMFVGRNVAHTIRNEGDTPLFWAWLFNPPGLEHVLAGLGTPRQPGQPRPQEVMRPQDVGELVLHFTKRGRPPEG